MEVIQHKKTIFQKIIEVVKSKMFSVISILLKGKQTGIFILSLGKWYSALLITIMIIQFIGNLFDENVILSNVIECFRMEGRLHIGCV